jgi:general stress protein 26
MMLRTIDADGRLLFLASQRSLIVAHLAAHPQVSITFVQPHDGLYVAIFGIGAIASDPAQVRPWWNWSYRAWYPRGWRDPDLVLLTVAVKQLEYWFAPSIRATRAARSIQASLLHRSGEDATHGILIVNGQHEPLP